MDSLHRLMESSLLCRTLENVHFSLDGVLFDNLLKFPIIFPNKKNKMFSMRFLFFFLTLFCWLNVSISTLSTSVEDKFIFLFLGPFTLLTHLVYGYKCSGPEVSPICIVYCIILYIIITRDKSSGAWGIFMTNIIRKISYRSYNIIVRSAIPVIIPYGHVCISAQY